MIRIAQSLALIGIAVAAPVWAVSSEDSWTAGSSLLVPLMATEMEANHASYVEIDDSGGGGTLAKSVDDVSFFRQATENGRQELAAARNALSQLKAPELKRIAEMLVNDHSGASARLSSIAAIKGWPIPAPQAAPSPPSGAGISDFDANWTAEMIAGHERSAALYRAQAQVGEDQDLRQYASETLITIEHHLAELRRLQK